MARSEYHEYDPVGQSFEGKDTEVPFSNPDSEDEPFLHSREPIRSPNLKWTLPWVLCALFATTSGILTFLLLHQTENLSDQHRYANDFIDPATIPLEQVRFAGSPQFSSNGTMSHKPFDPSISWPENVHYFGEPSPEIDENWEKLIGFRYFSISEEEAKCVWRDDYHEYVDQLQGGYTAGLDVFHTLHCVNAVRKALRPDYYTHTAHNEIPHVDHCLDAIRQYVQCAGVTTLIPTKFYEGIKRNYIDSDQVHTCRSFNYLRDWTTSRKAGSPSYVDRDLSIVDVRKNNLAQDRMAQIAAHLESLP